MLPHTRLTISKYTRILSVLPDEHATQQSDAICPVVTPITCVGCGAQEQYSQLLIHGQHELHQADVHLKALLSRLQGAGRT